ncbi:hypothetical protein [Amycolatopsis azurea]|uniref:hypothetical protein n=1 Tax=Amycolatopsis azurea TaxID=36819 RepID=UPI0012FA5A16|nr:hypothetical protein [Amycolatopsis azurea]
MTTARRLGGSGDLAVWLLELRRRWRRAAGAALRRARPAAPAGAEREAGVASWA